LLEYGPEFTVLVLLYERPLLLFIEFIEFFFRMFCTSLGIRVLFAPEAQLPTGFGDNDAA
jgi:hypothetical protein